MTVPGTSGFALSERHLAAALESLAEAVTVQGVDGRVLFANAAAVRMLGFDSLADLLAADSTRLMSRYRPFRPDGTPMPFEELPGRRVMQGGQATPQTLRWFHERSGEPRWSVVKATPLLGEDGSLVGAVNVIEDITEAAEADRARRILAQAARTLASSLDYEQTLQHVARLAVPTLADWCAVDLLDPRGEIVSVAVAHVDPEQVEFARHLRERYPIDRDDLGGVPAVIRDGVTSVVQDVSDEMLVAAARDEEHLRLLRDIGVRAGVVVPLSVAGRVIGALTLVLSGERARFSAGDVALAEELGRRAGAAVHNARMYTERGQISAVLQASMLPTALPEPDGWRIGLCHRASGEANDVGGDLYDVHEIDGRVLALVGDVVGKGASAAALAPRVRHTIVAATAITGDPADGLAVLDRALAGEPEPDRTGCTVASALLEAQPDGGARARILCAGHPPPLLLSGGRVREVGGPGRMLGLQDGAGARTPVTVGLGDGDVLVLFTDGVTEAAGADGRFGVPGLCSALEAVEAGASPQALVDAVWAALHAFTGGAQHDDVVVLALQRAATA